MTEDVLRNRLLKIAERLYHRLVLVVGPSQSGKTSILRKFGSNLQSTVIHINARLSEQMLEMTVKQRALQAPKLLEQIIATAGNTVLLDNIELIFDMQLQQDPMRLLQQLSRNRTIVAAWNGTISDGKLTYAESGHPEYRSYDTKDLVIVETMDEHRWARIG